MENKFIFKKIALVITSVSLASLVGCSNQADDNNKNSAKASSTEHQQKVESKKTVKTNVSKDMKKVGTPEYGYIKVPNDWIKFQDVNGNSSYQVCNGPSEIITLYLMKGDPEATLTDYANSVASGMEKQGAKDIKGAQFKLKNYDAIQVNGSYYNGEYLVVAWLFKTDDGSIHYIAAEGSKAKASEAAGYVKNGGWSAN